MNIEQVAKIEPGTTLWCLYWVTRIPFLDMASFIKASDVPRALMERKEQEAAFIIYIIKKNCWSLLFGASGHRQLTPAFWIPSTSYYFSLARKERGPLS